MNALNYLLCWTVCLPMIAGYGQSTKDDTYIAQLIATYQSDPRGPYRDIRWFCKDGTTLPPQERCPEKGGVQRARYKDEVIALGKNNHIFLGQILSTTSNEAFWDRSQNHSRIKQYQLEQFLKASDNGWVNQKAQFYRGAYQVEDEEAWGIQFYSWLLADAKQIEQNFFLIRQSAKDVPHAGDDNTAQLVRAVSKEISDQYNPFMNLRVKLHGTPESSDVAKVREFKDEHRGKLGPTLLQKFDQLIEAMELLYRPADVTDFTRLAGTLSGTEALYRPLTTFVEAYPQLTKSSDRCAMLSSTALALRKHISRVSKPADRLAIIDASNKIESMLVRESIAWKPATVLEQISKVHCLTEASGAFGYLELWELEELMKSISVPTGQEITLSQMNRYVENGRKAVEWGIGMVRAIYGDVVHRFAGFEPLANGFIDDRVRSSVLLPFGSSVSRLGDFFSAQAGFANNVMQIPNQSAMRGLNPGYAIGELIVSNAAPEGLEIQGDKIYVFDRPPADLKPVAGIATVTEGNLVSHVQLLARNLGIPNAVLSMENLQSLMKFNGERVFYAVSNSGTVIMKPAAQMTAAEKALFTKSARSEERIRVPIERMQLDQTTVLNMREVNASHSGKLCGPKAANLGQLKLLFPSNVVEGLVLPFGIFKKHVEQPMPQQGMSYWEFLNRTFSEADQQRNAGIEDSKVEAFVLSRLEVLRKAIKSMPLLPEFQLELQKMFKQVFGKELGNVPVFVRSDTNMEDLKDFTGAGLNLTLFNVLEADKILQGIKDVWASPYTERSYKWRQRYLLNPENVFPSILIIPSVNADCSGVLITKGVSTGEKNDLTIAFNRGVGGAVEGQASESWLISGERTVLLSPAREATYTTIPASGGTTKQFANFSERILTTDHLSTLKTTAESAKQQLSEAKIQGPYDIELGILNNHVWLFQVRPFVENKRAAGSDYIRSISPSIAGDKRIPLNSKI